MELVVRGILYLRHQGCVRLIPAEFENGQLMDVSASYQTFTKSPTATAYSANSLRPPATVILIDSIERSAARANLYLQAAP